ncbi:hypothetical protein Mgra_00005873 [Meloidogyne graminicola]|uniref:Aquaporin n=1 Tax=Meloidogyne graminicola TaxID=189291 RepID=A0A8S9ZN48_9BILA|nr:hypothetical protein Mgra_00005873 [Meloidogyne graminicola]
MYLWIASLFFYIFIFLFCELLRLITQKLLLQLCAPMFDVNFVMENYGLSGVFLEICFIEFVNSFLLRRAHADPCSLVSLFFNSDNVFILFWFFLFYSVQFLLCFSCFYNYINEHHSLRIASYLLATQFAAGYFSYLLSKTFFSLSVFILNIWKHLKKIVATIYGSAVEAFGLLGGKMAEYFINDNLINENFITLTLSIISGLITILGINLTGMYANPIVAWALTFNCGEVTHVAHFIVYWFAPLSAFFLSKWVFVDEQVLKVTPQNEKKNE